ncbi:hypothetical protein LSTR_LSTR016529 [Laodelphax striatellus]|uniref:Uncharacterized protein n=1 Tax=Laodelphax striatellus TaxID=195883 RepID=A0A482WML2_LAOST|nr:hypothetical protein LSTR_LSTR016529 [Laodelphax striatellus]
MRSRTICLDDSKVDSTSLSSPGYTIRCRITLPSNPVSVLIVYSMTSLAPLVQLKTENSSGLKVKQPTLSDIIFIIMDLSRTPATTTTTTSITSASTIAQSVREGHQREKRRLQLAAAALNRRVLPGAKRRLFEEEMAAASHPSTSRGAATSQPTTSQPTGEKKSVSS